MKINKIYLDKFKRSIGCYRFMVKKGVFLLFDMNTLEYQGYYAVYPYYKQTEIDECISKLVALDYLEV